MATFSKNSIHITGAVIIALFFAGVSLTHSAPNQHINYQGKLTDTSGVAVADGTYNMRFYLYDAVGVATTSAIWTEERTGSNRVTVTSGLFSVMLGSTTPLTSVDFNQTLYLGVEIGGSGGSPSWDGEMSPRKVLGTVPAAFEARQLDGLATTSFLRSDTSDTMEATSASTLLTITQNGAGDILNLFDQGTEVFSVADGGNTSIGTTSANARLTIQATGTSDIMNLFETGGLEVFTVQENGTVGIGTSTPQVELVVDGDMQLTGGFYDNNNTRGTNGQILQTTGSGVVWVSTTTLGLSDADTLDSLDSTQFLRSDQSNATGSITDFAFSVATGTRLVLGGDSITEFAGTGLTVTSGILSADLGTSIDASEIADGDHGAFTYNSGAATLDNSAVSSSTINAPNWTNGYVLQASTTAAGGIDWVATSTLGLSSGVSTFLALTDTPSSYTNQAIFFSSGSQIFSESDFAFASSTNTLTVGGMTIADTLTTHSVAATTTVVNNNPFAWTIATSTNGRPLLRVDTTVGAESVKIGDGSGNVFIGGIGAAANLVFEESSTISGQGTNVITLGVSGDTFTVPAGVKLGIGTSSPAYPFSVETGIHLSSTTPTTTTNTLYNLAGTLYFNGSAVGGGASTLSALTDVDTTGHASGSLLVSDGTNWYDRATSTLNINAVTLDSLDSTQFLRSDQANATGSITDFAFSVATGTRLVLGGDSITEFAGNGLVVSSGALTASITPSVLNDIGDPSDEFCLTYESTGSAFEWQSCGSSPFTTSGLLTYLTNTNEHLAAGTSTARALATFATSSNATATLALYQYGTADILNVFDGATEVFTILDGGAIGIGTSSPASKLDVWGDFRAGTSGTPSLFVDVSLDRVGLSTTTPQSLLALDATGLTGAVTAGVNEYFQFTNSTESAVYYGDRAYIVNAPTATSTLVGKIIRIEDSTALGNTVRGLEVQAHRGTNTKGENTALSGFARTFGVRGTTEGDAGGSFEPAGGFFETRGTTQGNALRGYSGTITTADLLSLFHESSAFSGTGLRMNFGNAGGTFAGTSSAKYLDFQNQGSSVFTVSAFGTTTIGRTGQTTDVAGLQIGYGGLCVDNDGSCSASTTGKITSVSSATGNSDLAEQYFSGEDLAPGEVVYTKGALSVGRASQSTKERMIGVVSTKPGLTLGFDDTSLDPDEAGYPIALSGRVPIRVSNEAGSVKAGDPLTLSSIPGVAMKATSTGRTIGIALEDFDGVRAYSDGYINQFGDDLVRPVVQDELAVFDARSQDGCSYSGGAELEEEPCVAKNLNEIVSAEERRRREEQARYDAELRARERALAGLAAEEAEPVALSGGRDAAVGQVLMFVDLGFKLVGDELLAELVASIEPIGSGADPGSNGAGDSLWSRLKALANSFVDGVLAILELRANRVEVKDELCIDGVCVTAGDLRAMLEASNNNGQIIEVVTDEPEYDGVNSNDADTNDDPGDTPSEPTDSITNSGPDDSGVSTSTGSTTPSAPGDTETEPDVNGAGQHNSGDTARSSEETQSGVGNGEVAASSEEGTSGEEDGTAGASDTGSGEAPVAPAPKSETIPPKDPEPETQQETNADAPEPDAPST